MHVVQGALLLGVFILFQGCFSSSRDKEARLDTNSYSLPEQRKKVLLVNSYHRGHRWTDGTVAGALRVFGAVEKEGGEIDNTESRVICRTVYMDTKRNRSEQFMQEAARQTVLVIESWQPDIVIAADDNAARFLIAPYYRNSAVPVVFCGINMDASMYGFPCRNITGMVEIPRIIELLKTMRPHARGDQTGYLGVDTFSSRKDAAGYEQQHGVRMHDVTYVKTFAQWKMSYRAMQEKVDMLIIGSVSGIEGWDEDEARQWVHICTAIPTGTNYSNLRNIALVSYAKVPGEQGEWAATTALDILKGKRPEDIPIAVNRKFRVYLNMKLAKQLGIKFPMDLLENATFTL